MPRLFIAGLFGLLCAMAATPALALSTYCVDTVAEFDSALAVAEDDDVRINIVQGNYDVRGTRLASDGPDLDIEAAVTMVGGYAAGCTSRSYDASLTTLSAGNTTALYLGVGGEITLAELTFKNFTGMDLKPYTPVTVFSIAHDLRLDHVRFVNGGSVVVDAENVSLKQVAVTGSTGGCGFRVQPSFDFVLIENSLFANNANDGFCAGYAGGAVGDWDHVAIYNSIFWNNGGDDISTLTDGSESDVVLRNNIYQSADVVPPSSSAPVGTLNQDPKFVDAASGNFHLANDSPARDSAIAQIPDGLPTTDIEGLQRAIGSGLDRGPYENQSAGALFLYSVTNTNDAGAGSLRQA